MPIGANDLGSTLSKSRKAKRFGQETSLIKSHLSRQKRGNRIFPVNGRGGGVEEREGVDIRKFFSQEGQGQPQGEGEKGGRETGGREGKRKMSGLELGEGDTRENGRSKKARSTSLKAGRVYDEMLFPQETFKSDTLLILSQPNLAGLPTRRPKPPLVTQPTSRARAPTAGGSGATKKFVQGRGVPRHYHRPVVANPSPSATPTEQAVSYTSASRTGPMEPEEGEEAGVKEAGSGTGWSEEYTINESSSELGRSEEEEGEDIELEKEEEEGLELDEGGGYMGHQEEGEYWMGGAESLRDWSAGYAQPEEQVFEDEPGVWEAWGSIHPRDSTDPEEESGTDNPTPSDRQPTHRTLSTARVFTTSGQPQLPSSSLSPLTRSATTTSPLTSLRSEPLAKPPIPATAPAVHNLASRFRTPISPNVKLSFDLDFLPKVVELVEGGVDGGEGGTGGEDVEVAGLEQVEGGEGVRGGEEDGGGGEDAIVGKGKGAAYDDAGIRELLDMDEDYAMETGAGIGQGWKGTEKGSGEGVVVSGEEMYVERSGPSFFFGVEEDDDEE